MRLSRKASFMSTSVCVRLVVVGRGAYSNIAIDEWNSGWAGWHSPFLSLYANPLGFSYFFLFFSSDPKLGKPTLVVYKMENIFEAKHGRDGLVGKPSISMRLKGLLIRLLHHIELVKNIG